MTATLRTAAVREPRFLAACRRQPTDCTPVWFMRQAGRYMPEYRRLRARHSMLELLRDPDQAAAITLQPLEAFGVDAAIVFSDILLPLDGLGLGLRFVEGRGPVFERPICEPADVRRAADRLDEGLAAIEPTLGALRNLRRVLKGRVPLIGFAGAPFTLAVYALGGGGSRGAGPALRFAAEHPRTWARWLRVLAELAGGLLAAQIRAGASAVQLFDTWAAVLDPGAYRRWALPAAARALRAACRPTTVPAILFAGRSSHLLSAMRSAGAEVISVGEDIPLDEAWQQLGGGFAVQGNLDPRQLLGPRRAMFAAAREVLRRAGNRPGHIFNLGHGVPKETDPARIRDLVEFVHLATRRPAAQLASFPP
ncbi:MAG: uroporphyrinogen decarboxylase [Kiritimatiellae bacterium]|nr:uroporphyrinogen decarboxylase [Kiritimatiellia bacterium]